MHTLAIAHSVFSFLTLVLGLAAWLNTSSRSVAFNTLLGSSGLLFSAYLLQTGTDPQLAYIIPFLVFAIFGGRAIGLALRSRAETALRVPSALLGAVSVLALIASGAAFLGV